MTLRPVTDDLASAAARHSPASHGSYAPHRRTALVLTGTGTAGAYHAGVLRALHEAGVKIDLVAGRGIGAVGATFAAVDGAAQLWASGGLWHSPSATQLYRWRPALRISAWILGLTLAAVLLPLGIVLIAALIYPLAYLLRVGGLPGAETLNIAFGRLVGLVFAPAALPTWLPRLVVVALVAFLAVLIGTAGVDWFRARRRRRSRGALWWLLLGAPLDGRGARGWFADGLWKLMRGAASVAQPSPGEMGQQYGDLLLENLGQPGFRELLIMAHDLDGRRDVSFALLADPYRRRFFEDQVGAAHEDRELESVDLAGDARPAAFDACAAALSLPVATDPWLLTFAPSSGWRGETHRVCDRPDALGHLLDEVARAGAEQVILVSALPGPTGPHTLGAGRRDGRGRIGESVAAMEAAVVRDAVRTRAGLFQQLFEIRPRHNPLGPFDFAGCYDELSDREQSIGELVERGYEDGHRQFVGPVIGASGEEIERAPTPRMPRTTPSGVARGGD